MISNKEKQLVLKLARDAIMNRENSIAHHDVPDVFQEPHGVFVTLTIGGELRGCIGNLLPEEPVISGVLSNAVNAAYHDPRFPPLSRREFDRVRIEISILSDPVLVGGYSAEHLLTKLNHAEGLILKQGSRMATFLPQVWEQLPGKEEFLAQLCMKAGMHPDTWKESDVEVYGYRVEKFEE